MARFNNLYNTPDAQRFHSPTRILHGRGCRGALAEMAGPGPAVLVVDRHFADHPHGLTLAAQLPMIHRVVVDGEPRASQVRAALADLHGRAWTTLVALGGGSTLDTAKAILADHLFGSPMRVGYGALREIPDLLPGDAPVRFFALPTTAGTGSETSRYYLVSDDASHEKQVGRSWALCPFTAFLDPELLEEAPMPLLAACAFDAFTHLWETLHCRQEASPLVGALAQEGILRLMRALETLEADRPDRTNALLDLQQASAWGGIALSNVRTGLLHGAGEALAAQVDLPHPLSLYVFFQASLDLFGPALAARLEPLRGRTPAPPLEHLAAFWSGCFERHGLHADLENRLARQPWSTGPILEKLLTDQVLLNKEAPLPLERAALEAFLNSAHRSWGRP